MLNPMLVLFAGPHIWLQDREQTLNVTHETALKQTALLLQQGQHRRG